MKKHIQILTLLALTITVITSVISCDKVDAPYLEKSTTPVITPSNTACDNDGFVAANAVRKILLIDFTGHKCGNCPQAHAAATAVHNQYGNKVVTVAIHATNTFAAPNGGGTKYLYDFRTALGNDLDATFGLESIGLPQGWINKYDTAKFDDYSTWASQDVPAALNKPAEAFLIIKNEFNNSTKTLNTTVNTHVLSTITGNFKLCVWLIEDSVINWQKDYSLPSGSQDIQLYNHKHPLRASITTATKGDAIATTGGNITLKKDTCFSNAYAFTNFGATWDLTKLKVVAFIYNTQTKQVVQAEEKGW
ncbi:MAG: Omp28-related outer membrane protein [Bacteroidia bacterium]